MKQRPTRRDLSGQDLAFLAWEAPERPMQIAVRADFAAPANGAAPGLEALRRELAQRVRREPLLRSRLDTSRGRRPCWIESSSVRIEDHVFPVSPCGAGPAPQDEALDALLRRPLDPTRPLWEIGYQPGPRAHEFSLLIKLHHALIDGVGAVRLLERMFGDAPPPRTHERDAGKRGSPRPFRIRSVLRFVRDQLRRGPSTPLNGPPAPLRFRDFEIDAPAFDAHATRLGVTRNDLVLACISRSLARRLARNGQAVPETIHAFCPVDLRESANAEDAGNRISTWYVPLALHASDVATAAATIHASTRALRRDGAERGGDGMARVIERWGSWVAKLGAALAARGRAHQLVVSSVSGPRTRIEVLGASLTRVAAFAPLMPGQRLTVAVVKHGDRLCWGLTDATPLAAGHAIADALKQELSAIESPQSREVA